MVNILKDCNSINRCEINCLFVSHKIALIMARNSAARPRTNQCNASALIWCLHRDEFTWCNKNASFARLFSACTLGAKYKILN